MRSRDLNQDQSQTESTVFAVVGVGTGVKTIKITVSYSGLELEVVDADNYGMIASMSMVVIHPLAERTTTNSKKVVMLSAYIRGRKWG